MQVNVKIPQKTKDRAAIKTHPFLKQLIGKTPQEAMAKANQYMDGDIVKIQEVVSFLVGKAAYDINLMDD